MFLRVPAGDNNSGVKGVLVLVEDADEDDDTFVKDI
ncbi:not available [Yersinia enterocolitica]|nr:not available [Yersinia enterocolitica]